MLNRRVAFAVVASLLSSSALAVDCTPAALREALATHANADQAARKALMANPSDKNALDIALRTDRDNTAWMREVVAQCNWPKQSEVGKEGAMHAWLMAQHADMSPDFQVAAAAAMKEAVLAGEANGGALSRLVDRNRMQQKQPQAYALNPEVTPAKTLRFDIEDPANLDARRKEIGLAPFYCHAVEMSESRKLPIEWPQGVLFIPTECPEAE
ncbi:hypothetical protein LK996_15105 [Lysobacter sp. A6]|uniref:Secreted protein n=1 Tax=Noviluteimonas lactosilytica TaxID=2888523 RepID=A0ABS8JLA5_9GAMM|nr:DUF6624 domain-containing protein [Lysobacter lactosilyticus]MCC8364399.1 hypothetical protein [Lysobacter lactosilyticus]